MYEELRGNLMAQATHFSVHDETSLLLLKAADAIEELQKQLREEKVDNVNLTWWLAEEHAKHRWIPVTERLPKGGDESGQLCDNVILLLSVKYNKNYVTAGWINGVTKKVYYLDEKDDYIHKTDMSVVKAWMPLPQPPESEATFDNAACSDAEQSRKVKEE